MASSIGSISLANNQFSIDLYKTLIAPQQPTKNAVISPFSIFSALAMLDVGAGGTTREELLLAMKLKSISGGANEQINAGFKELFSKVLNQSKNSERPWEQPTTLNVANRVYLQQGFDTKPSFGNTLQSHYNSDLGKVDFGQHLEAAKKEINEWVEKVTNNKIKDLASDLTQSTVLALISAIYFKAEWEDSFMTWKTSDMDFFVTGGHSVRTEMMQMTTSASNGFFAEFANLDATALLKPFTQSTVHMIFILPNKKDGLPALERSISIDVFNVSRYKKSVIEITLPKYKIEDDYSLTDGLKKLGINSAFSGNANFSGISNGKVVVSAAIHKVMIDVYEKGVEAAAATLIALMGSSPQMIVKDKRVFKADHPFLFAIQHRDTGAVLFLGRVENPSSK